MLLSNLQIFAEKDLKLNRNDLALESLRTPEIHNVWMKYLSIEKLSLYNLENKYNILYKKRWDFYLGNATAEEYAENPFSKKVIRGDINIYINADIEICKLLLKVKLAEEKVNFILETIKQINGRNWHIGNAIKWKTFINGEN